MGLGAAFGGLSDPLAGLQAQQGQTAKIELTLEHLPDAIRGRAVAVREVRYQVESLIARIRGFGANTPKQDEPDLAPSEGDTLLVKADVDLAVLSSEIGELRGRIHAAYGLLFPGELDNVL
jgi:hypothetical protein